jgi:hypothetical protein
MHEVDNQITVLSKKQARKRIGIKLILRYETSVIDYFRMRKSFIIVTVFILSVENNEGEIVLHLQPLKIY